MKVVFVKNVRITALERVFHWAYGSSVPHRSHRNGCSRSGYEADLFIDGGGLLLFLSTSHAVMDSSSHLPMKININVSNFTEQGTKARRQ